MIKERHERQKEKEDKKQRKIEMIGRRQSR